MTGLKRERQRLMAIGRRVFLATATCGLLGACTGAGRTGPTAEARAAEAGLVRFVADADGFRILGRRRKGTGAPAEIYIEGDGRAFTTPVQPSRDPTPHDPLGLRLAIRSADADSRRPIGYLARPCQYLLDQSPRCERAYWTDKRYAPTVRDAMGAALSETLRQLEADAAVLVGYSGGGVMAALLAAERSDVLALITAAAPLDLAQWVKAKDLTPLTGSLDPAADRRLARIPQVHFIGAEDAVVPASVARAYIRRVGGLARDSVFVVPDADHRCCWDSEWPSLLDAARLRLGLADIVQAPSDA